MFSTSPQTFFFLHLTPTFFLFYPLPSKNHPFLFPCCLCVARQPCNCGAYEEREEKMPCVGRHCSGAPTLVPFSQPSLSLFLLHCDRQAKKKPNTCCLGRRRSVVFVINTDLCFSQYYSSSCCRFAWILWLCCIKED